MTETVGGCECGAVRYRIGGTVHVYACHCLNCQTRSGSAFGEHAMVACSDFMLEGATVARSRVVGDAAFEEVFCEACLTRVFNRYDLMPDVVILRAGTLAESGHVTPIAHIWTKRKQGWVLLPADVPASKETPTPAEFQAAVEAAQRSGSGMLYSIDGSDTVPALDGDV